jgi:DNA-binding transcriptional ArsR family regulator
MRLETETSQRRGGVAAEGLAAKAREAADLLKALAHESRLTILSILSDGERSVTELEHLLALRQPTVSQQLARLRTDGLVSFRRDGKTVYYSLANDDIRILLDAVRHIFCRTEHA